MTPTMWKLCRLAPLLGALSFMPIVVHANDGGGPTPGEVMQHTPAKPRPAKLQPIKKSPVKVKVTKKRQPRTAVVRPTQQVRKAPTPAVGQVERAPSGQPPQEEERLLADEVIVRFRLSSSYVQRENLVRQLGIRHIEARTFALAGITVHRYGIAFGTPVRTIIAALEADPTVVYAQPNYLYVAQAGVPSASVPQYAVDRLGVKVAHTISRGAGATLAIVDSAVEVGHTEFAGAAIEVFDVRDSTDVPPDLHGTSIAGAIAAAGTLTGVAPEARVLAIAAFAPSEDGRIRGNTWSVAKALEIAHSNGARLLNLSFAGPADALVGRSLEGAARRGMTAIAAAGNEGPDAPPLYPAAYPTVIAVTATDAADSLYAHASGGLHIALAAPGVDIVTVAPGGAFGIASGTSLATAHVTGIAALLLSADPLLQRLRLIDVLSGNATDLGEPGRDTRFGLGIPSAEAALKALGTQ
jgi:subtilisin family serine protease